MDSFEWNKIFGGILASLLAVMVIREVGGVLFHDEPLAEQAYKIEVPDVAVASAARAEEHVVDLGTLLQTASASAGERVAARCLSCHNFEKGGANQIGPNLWGVMGRDIASIGDFNYSGTLEGLEGVWTYEKMNGYLENPRSWAPGTLMAFAGLNRESDRANILAYMQQQADSAVPFPDPVVADAPVTDDAAAADAPAAAEAKGADAPRSDEPAGETDGDGEEDGAPGGGSDDAETPDLVETL